MNPKIKRQDGGVHSTPELFTADADEARGDDNAKKYVDWLKPKKTIQLAASGPVKITALERKIIDTADFQRLRGIKQLGAAYWVYPTATHTRFDHSLGTLQMVAEMIAKIRGNENIEPEHRHITRRQELLARLYALIHDITHVPFGHTLEDELRLLTRHDRNRERVERFLGSEQTIGQIIISELGSEGPSIHAELLALYNWDEKSEPLGFPGDDAFVHDLVSNTVCADLLDYIRRDDLFCNLGVSIRYHFLDYLSLTIDPEKKLKRVCIRLWKTSRKPRRDLLTDLCGLMWARYKLAERVYFHHAKANASAILGRALQEHFNDVDRADMEKWILEQTDETVLDALCKSKSEVARDLGARLRRRELYRRLRRTYSLNEIRGVQTSDYSISLDKKIENALLEPQARRQFENLLAELVLAAPGDVLIYAPTRKMNLKPAQMKVEWEGGLKVFGEIDDPVVRPQLDLILDSHRHLWKVRIFCKPTLTEQQCVKVQEAFNIEVMELDPEVQKVKREALCRDMIQTALRADDGYSNAEEKAKQEKLDMAALEMTTWMSHHVGDAQNSIKGKLDQVIRRYWRIGPDEKGKDKDK